jgi:hypothetical protein
VCPKLKVKTRVLVKWGSMSAFNPRVKMTMTSNPPKRGTEDIVARLHGLLRAALHLEARPISLEADCTKFQPYLGWRSASTTHYNKIRTGVNFPICKGPRAKKPSRFNKFSKILAPLSFFLLSFIQDGCT